MAQTHSKLARSYDRLDAELLTPYYEDGAVTIYHGDCREIVPQLPKSALCFDDPPYLEGDWWRSYDLLRQSAQRLVVTPGAKNSSQWIDAAHPFWTYCWLCYSNSLGGSACLKISWEPILAFDRPCRPLGTDVLKFGISAQVGVGDHPWPKPLGLMRKLVSHFSNEGDTVLDPHAGVGTTLRAAKDCSRKSIGIEIEEKYCEIAAQRMAQEVFAV